MARMKEAGSVLIKGVEREKSSRVFWLHVTDCNSVLSSPCYPGLRRDAAGPPWRTYTRVRSMHDVHNDGGCEYTYRSERVTYAVLVHICTYVAAYLPDALLSVVLPGRIPLGPITFDLSAGCRR